MIKVQGLRLDKGGSGSLEVPIAGRWGFRMGAGSCHIVWQLVEGRRYCLLPECSLQSVLLS